MKIPNDNYVYVLSPQTKQYGGSELSQGEVFEFQGLRNDELLLKHGYVKKMSAGEETKDCGVCKRRFKHDSGLINHQRSHRTGALPELGALEPKGAPAPKRMEQIYPPQRTKGGSLGLPIGAQEAAALASSAGAAEED